MTDKDEPLHTEIYDVLATRCNSLLDQLFRDGLEGKMQSFSKLVEVAVKAKERIDILTKKQPSIARQIARKRIEWPTVVTVADITLKRHRILAENLELGQAVKFQFNVKKVGFPNTVAAEVTSRLLIWTDLLRKSYDLFHPEPKFEEIKESLSHSKSQEGKAMFEKLKQLDIDTERIIDSISDQILALGSLGSFLDVPCRLNKTEIKSYVEKAWKLPPLSASTVKAWFTFGRAVIFRCTNDLPERNPVLRPLGEYRKDAYYNKSGLSKPEIQTRRASGKARATEDANIRDGIFERIRSAYKMSLSQG